MIQRSAGIAALLALGMTGSVWAQSGATGAADAYDDRFYLQGQGGVIFSDSSGLDSGGAGYFGIGKPLTSFFSLELEGGYANLGTDFTGDYERVTGQVNGVLYLWGGPTAESMGTIRPFLMGGANLHSVDYDGGSTSGAGFQVGGGATYPLSRDFEFVSSLRYGIDSVSADANRTVNRDEDYYTWTATFGVRWKMGSFPPDTDGDGVPDHRDQCPGTPAGVTVDRDGCPIDSDGDGVADHRDRCPGTPEGAAVDAQGCPVDSDGDGVPDHRDECPNTPEGVRVDQRGCPFKDSDGDGVPDARDRCPGTPPGVAVNAQGCPLDSDGDGVPDFRDECPQTPEGAAVLPSGCALVGDKRLARPGEPADADGFATERTQNFILEGVTFEFDSSRLTPEARSILNQAAEVLEAYPDVDVDVEGHTDSVGPDAYNLALSERRATAVKAYLVQQGITAGRMTPVGYGETIPIATNDTEEGRSNNRRVEFRVR